MKKLLIFLFLIQLMPFKGYSQYNLHGISIKNIENQSFKWDEVNQDLTAIVFLAPECPLSQQYTLPLKEIQKKYAKNLAVVGVFPGKDYTDADYLKFKNKYQIPFPLLNDDHFKLVRLLNATITPQIFLVDDKGQLLYHGAIDNKVVSLGATRAKASQFYLENAINSYLNHLPIKVSQTKAIGCYIEMN